MKSWTRWALGAAAIAIVAGIAAYFPDPAEFGAALNRAAAWANPPRDNIRIGGGNRYRREEQARQRRERRQLEDAMIRATAGMIVAEAIEIATARGDADL